jgi:hypothetical protein
MTAAGGLEPFSLVDSTRQPGTFRHSGKTDMAAVTQK